MIYEIQETLDMLTVAKDLATNNEDGIVLNIAKEIWMASGQVENSYSKLAKEKYNLNMYEGIFIGGTAIVFPGDISILQLKHDLSDIGTRIINKTKDFLASRNIESFISGNDLLIAEGNENYKVASWGSGWKAKDYTENVVHISIGMDEELVDEICTKNCVKKPRGLSYYGIKTSDILDIIKPELY